MINASISIFALLAILAGFVCLQIFLSKCKNKWFGLVLPVNCLAYSFLAIFAITAYDGMNTAGIAALFAVTFLITNIPTAVLLVIYFACREKFKPNKEMEKMNIQDL